MPSGVKFNSFAAYMPNGAVNLGSSQVKVMLTNTIPNSLTQAVYTDISGTEVGSGNGYTTGGEIVTLTSSTQSGGNYKYIGSMGVPTWTAGPSTMGTFRWVVMYCTVGVKPLIGWWDYGSPLALSSTQTFTITLDATNGVLQLS